MMSHFEKCAFTSPFSFYFALICYSIYKSMSLSLVWNYNDIISDTLFTILL